MEEVKNQIGDDHLHLLNVIKSEPTSNNDVEDPQVYLGLSKRTATCDTVPVIKKRKMIKVDDLLLRKEEIARGKSVEVTSRKLEKKDQNNGVKVSENVAHRNKEDLEKMFERFKIKDYPPASYRQACDQCPASALRACAQNLRSKPTSEESRTLQLLETTFDSMKVHQTSLNKFAHYLMQRGFFCEAAVIFNIALRQADTNFLYVDTAGERYAYALHTYETFCSALLKGLTGSNMSEELVKYIQRELGSWYEKLSDIRNSTYPSHYNWLFQYVTVTFLYNYGLVSYSYKMVLLILAGRKDDGGESSFGRPDKLYRGLLLYHKGSCELRKKMYDLAEPSFIEAGHLMTFSTCQFPPGFECNKAEFVEEITRKEGMAKKGKTVKVEPCS